jgi:hypothetical protein
MRATSATSLSGILRPLPRPFAGSRRSSLNLLTISGALNSGGLHCIGRGSPCKAVGWAGEGPAFFATSIRLSGRSPSKSNRAVDETFSNGFVSEREIYVSNTAAEPDDDWGSRCLLLIRIFSGAEAMPEFNALARLIVRLHRAMPFDARPAFEASTRCREVPVAGILRYRARAPSCPEPPQLTNEFLA